MNKEKWVYLFKEGRADMKSLLGGKGANLAEMTILGLHVPLGFIISTQACGKYYQENRKFPEGLDEQITHCLEHLEKSMGRNFCQVPDPVFLSVRSGSPVSMPGMMDSILNLGLNDMM